MELTTSKKTVQPSDGRLVHTFQASSLFFSAQFHPNPHITKYKESELLANSSIVRTVELFAIVIVCWKYERLKLKSRFDDVSEKVFQSASIKQSSSLIFQDF